MLEVVEMRIADSEPQSLHHRTQTFVLFLSAVDDRTRVSPRDERSHSWQQELRKRSYAAQKGINFDPTRRMF